MASVTSRGVIEKLGFAKGVQIVKPLTDGGLIGCIVKGKGKRSMAYKICVAIRQLCIQHPNLHVYLHVQLRFLSVKRHLQPLSHGHTMSWALVGG